MNTATTAPTLHRPVAEHRRNQIGLLRSSITAMLPQFAAALPPHIPAQQFARVVMTAVQQKPELAECDRLSFFNACMRAAQDGLLPDGRLGTITSFYNRKRNVRIAQWMVMVAGLRQKVRNSGEIGSWECHLVHENDEYSYEEGDNAHIMHKPARGNRGEIVAAYSIARFRTGEISREWMWREEVEAVRRRSASPDEGPWVTDYGEMVKKTVAKRHSKVLPMSTDVLGLINRRDDELMQDTPPMRPLPVEPRALSEALDMLGSGPGADGDGEFADEPEQRQRTAADDAAAVRAELREEHRQMHGEETADREEAEQQDTERLAYLQQLNDAAAVGTLDEVFRRFPAKWRRALADDFEQLKHRGSSGAAS